jgi:hypothetical protein
MAQTSDSIQHTIDAEVEYILQLEAKLELDFSRSQQEYLEPEQDSLEIDSVSDCFGTIFRVWQGQSVIGIFYQVVSGNGWIAESFRSNQKPQWCASDKEAQKLIQSA